MSIAFDELQANGLVDSIHSMKTVAETRRERLEELIRRHGSIAVLNEALEWPRTDPKLTQIRNANARKGRATPYQMGHAMARQIEQKLGLSRGWMDTAAESAEDGLPAALNAEAAPLSHVALEIARLFDLIPATDTVKRAQAQMACAQAIIALLQPAPAGRARTTPDKKTQSK